MTGRDFTLESKDIELAAGEYGERLPNTVDVAARVVVLPTGTAVTPDDCRLIGEFVVSRLRGYCAERG